MSPIEIIEFWFSARVRPRWFSSTPRFDEEIAERFGSLWERAARGGLDGWQDTPEGALALVVILDQFPLNMFRGDARSFSTEAAAIAVTKAALVRGLDRRLPPDQRAFLYMPLMHSEVLADQELAVELYDVPGLESNLAFARHHREIVRRFGRFPHRNAPLDRPSTPEERRYLASEEAFKG